MWWLRWHWRESLSACQSYILESGSDHRTGQVWARSGLRAVYCQHLIGIRTLVVVMLPVIL